jgi:hypothetical protein
LADETNFFSLAGPERYRRAIVTVMRQAVLCPRDTAPCLCNCLWIPFVTILFQRGLDLGHGAGIERLRNGSEPLLEITKYRDTFEMVAAVDKDKDVPAPTIGIGGTIWSVTGRCETLRSRRSHIDTLPLHHMAAKRAQTFSSHTSRRSICSR